MKNQQKAIATDKKLDVISWREKGEWIVDMCCNDRLTYNSTLTIRDSGDKIKESAQSGSKVFV